MLKERHKIFVSLLLATDTAVVAGSQWLTWMLASRSESSTSALLPTLKHAAPLILHLPLLVVCMVAVGLYRPRRDRSFFSEFIDILKAMCFGWGVFMIALQIWHVSVFRGEDSSYYLAIYPCFMIAALTIHRFVFRVIIRHIRQRGWNQRHFAIIGTGRLGQNTHRTFSRNSWTGMNCAYFISHHDTTTCKKCLSRPVIGGLDNMTGTLDKHLVDGVIIAIPQSRSHLLPNILQRLGKYAGEVRIVPDISPKYMPINLGVSELDGMPLLSLRQSPLNGFGGFFKRILDIVIASIAILFFAVPMIGIVAAICFESRGGAIFKQTRVSLGGKQFKIYKFRTMQNGIPTTKDNADENGWTTRDDTRITAVGRWLRRTSLDELPQLINVIRGDMSLVGPRPEQLDLLDRFRDNWRGYTLRQNIKAGMTGWAQVNGLRGDTSLRKRVQYDLYYIRNWSFAFDLRILILTLFRGFVHPNAH